MFRSKCLNLQGLQISGDEPITPRTQAFLTQHNMQVTQQSGYVSVTGHFSLSKTDVEAFLENKTLQDAGIQQEESRDFKELEKPTKGMKPS